MEFYHGQTRKAYDRLVYEIAGRKRSMAFGPKSRCRNLTEFTVEVGEQRVARIAVTALPSASQAD